VFCGILDSWHIWPWCFRSLELHWISSTSKDQSSLPSLQTTMWTTSKSHILLWTTRLQAHCPWHSTHKVSAYLLNVVRIRKPCYPKEVAISLFPAYNLIFIVQRPIFPIKQPICSRYLEHHFREYSLGIVYVTSNIRPRSFKVSTLTRCQSALSNITFMICCRFRCV